MKKVIPAGTIGQVVKGVPASHAGQLAGVVDITLRHGPAPKTYEALVDTGAERTAIPKPLAEELGLDLVGSPSEMAMGFGGSCRTWHVGGIEVEWEGQVFATSVVVMDDPMAPVVVGVEDFLAMFDVEFRLGKQQPTIVISKEEDMPSSGHTAPPSGRGRGA